MSNFGPTKAALDSAIDRSLSQLLEHGEIGIDNLFDLQAHSLDINQLARLGSTR